MEIPEKTLTDVCALLVDNTCKGMGKLGSLIFGSQFRKKEYRDALMAAQAEKDAKAIAAGEARFDGTALIPALALPSMPLNVPLEYLPMLEGQRQEVNNLNANLNVALSILADTEDDKISDEPVSPDWFARWRREAQVIGDQGLQNIWGRILAEEVKKPKSVSLKTLDVLKNVTATDAELFCHVVKFRILTVIASSRHFSSFPYSVEQLLHLQSLGLLVGGDLTPVPQKCETLVQKVFLCQGYALLFDLPNNSPLRLGISGPALSSVGEEILKVSDSIPEPDLATVKIVGDFVWRHLPDTCQGMEARSMPDGVKLLHSWHR